MIQRLTIGSVARRLQICLGLFTQITSLAEYDNQKYQSAQPEDFPAGY